jgi:hypothetical protein
VELTSHDFSDMSETCPDNCASPLRVAHGSASRACAHRPKMELRLDIVQKLAHDGREEVMMRVSVRARGIVLLTFPFSASFPVVSIV